jgi:hypothetical protein
MQPSAQLISKLPQKLLTFYDNSAGRKEILILQLSFLPLLPPAHLCQKDERVLPGILTAVNFLFPL